MDLSWITELSIGGITIVSFVAGAYTVYTAQNNTIKELQNRLALIESSLYFMAIDFKTLISMVENNDSLEEVRGKDFDTIKNNYDKIIEKLEPKNTKL